MQKRPWEISDLLALRDGELREAGVDADDVEVAAKLEQIRHLQAELNSLGDVPLDEGVWNTIALETKPRSTWLRFPLATAASVFFASVIGIYVLFSDIDPNGTVPVAEFSGAAVIDTNGVRLASLMSQSQDLEMRLQGADPWARASSQVADESLRTPSSTLTERRLMGRLADVDWQIARLYDAEDMDVDRREALWERRVNLLESLVAVRGGTDPSLFEDSRSM
jgi:hypothetical protein